MIQVFEKINKVKGTLYLPGDKSISHRAIIFSSMASGKSRIKNLSTAEDVNSTRECFKNLGVEFYSDNLDLIVSGKGYKNFQPPVQPLNAGNSGTTARLLSGLLICQDFNSIISGDDSLSQRPMKRILDPFKQMGSEIESSANFTLPLKISPSKKISPLNYTLPIASAQVKSAILIAGLHFEGETSVTETVRTRNHTEKMLGLKVEEAKDGIVSYSSKENYPEAKEYFVPSDISTAGFFVVLTLLTDNSSLIIKNVSLNNTRTGYIEVLRRMGASIEIENQHEQAGEEFGDLVVKSSKLINVKIPAELIPNIIDEIPILSIAGIFAEGDFEISNAIELRGKESDRIKSVCENVKLLGLNAEEKNDGFCISGNIKKRSAVFQSNNDHRIAMAFSILSMLLGEGGKVNDFDCVKISNPQFLDQLKNLVN